MSRSPRAQEARRSWGRDDSATPILHVDMDAFFASVELLERPELIGRPVIVGGTSGRGVVSAASYEARAYGVASAMSMAEAHRRCPQAVVLPVRHGLYSQVSRRVMAILEQVTPAMEKVSVDEAFLDVSGARRRMGSPVEIAQWIRAEIRRRVGVPASVGIASTKFVAKLASSHAKPDGLLLVPADATRDFLDVLPVGALWGVGDKSAQVLKRWGIHDVRALAATDVRRLEKILGTAAGRHLHDLARGIDPRPVSPGREEKSVGTESTFFETITDRAHARRVLLDQTHQCAARACARGTCAGASSSSRRAAPTSSPSPARALCRFQPTSRATCSRSSSCSSTPCPRPEAASGCWESGWRAWPAPTTAFNSCSTRIPGAGRPSAPPMPFAGVGGAQPWLPPACWTPERSPTGAPVSEADRDRLLAAPASVEAGGIDGDDADDPIHTRERVDEGLGVLAALEGHPGGHHLPLLRPPRGCGGDGGRIAQGGGC